MEQRKFTVIGKPCGKARPRFVRATGRTYTPAKTVNAETLVKLSYLQTHGDKSMFIGPVWVQIFAYFDRPKYHYNKAGVKIAAPTHSTSRPDCDNICKLVCDALNNVAWHDDAQVARVEVVKLYAEPNEYDRMEIYITGMEK